MTLRLRRGRGCAATVTAVASTGMKPVIPPALAYDKAMANALAANLAQVNVGFQRPL